MQLDIKLMAGNVYDGSGSEPFTADVGIFGDRIVAIGDLSHADASRCIDAAGSAVTPGFIDLHTHSDASFLIDSLADSKLRQGVTLELMGNCGMSFCAPLRG